MAQSKTASRTILASLAAYDAPSFGISDTASFSRPGAAGSGQWRWIVSADNQRDAAQRCFRKPLFSICLSSVASGVTLFHASKSSKPAFAPGFLSLRFNGVIVLGNRVEDRPCKPSIFSTVNSMVGIIKSIRDSHQHVQTHMQLRKRFRMSGVLNQGLHMKRDRTVVLLDTA